MFTATILRIMIASPGDTAEQRRVIREAIDGWNAGQAERDAVVLLPLTWELDSVPLWGRHPQLILNEQLVDRADALIATFSTRLGTATPTAASGTVEEIEQGAKKNIPVLLYFDGSPIDRSAFDLDQYSALQRFRRKANGESFYREYTSLEDLRFQVSVALPQLVEQIDPPRRPNGLGLEVPIVSVDLDPQDTGRGVRTGTRTRYYLKVQNPSRKPLTDIRVELRPEEGVDSRRGIPRLVDADRAISALAPGGSVRFPVTVEAMVNPQCDVALSWSTGDGEAHESVSTVRFT